jgi:2-polyprenyl-3-methyl-5-hydroxy-6-metoxy-1,4-benzoquinol methylase
MMKATAEEIDRSLDMAERKWWDLWNTSYRAQENLDPVCTQLFAHMASVVEQATQGQPGRILEVACGAGALSRQLNFASYHGLDISAAAIDIARSRTKESYLGAASARTYEVADFHEWPPALSPVDTVICVDALHSFRDPSFVARKIATMLHSDGIFIVATINPFVYNRIRRVGGVKLENGPVSHWLSRGELHRLVRQAGLSIERSYTIMPRGNMGLLRILNSSRLNEAFGPRAAAMFKRLKERAGLGQYRVVLARKT